MTYLTDNATIEDALAFGDFRAALNEIVTTAETPLTVGVFGTWGSGKTSLMRMLRDDIEKQGLAGRRTVWFTAWKYDQQDVLWRALILRVLDALYPRESGEGAREEREILKAEKGSPEEKLIALLNRLEESVYQAVDWEEIGPRAINWWQFVGGVSKAGLETAATLGTAGLFPQLKKLAGGDDTPADDIKKAAQAISKEARQYHRRQLRHMEEFETMFKEAVQLIAPNGEGRLVVFVDDLDRCLPEKAIEVVEAIKLFLEAPGVVFVLGMDKDVVQKGIEARYGTHFRQMPDVKSELPITGDSYLQKIVQIPFHLPSLAVEDVEGYIDALAKGMGERTRQVIARGVYPNPRQVKRVLNIFNLLRTIAGHRFGEGSDQIADPLLAKTVLIQTQHPRLYQLWRQYPVVVQMLEEAYDRDRISDEEILTGRRLSRPQSGELADSGDVVEPRPPAQERGKGQLDNYLNDRAKYARLARMLTYPPADEAGEGRNLARFGGLKLSQLAAYVRLAGAVESETAEAAPVTLSADLLANFLSDDDVVIRIAASQLESEEPEKGGPKHKAVQEQLIQIVSNPARTVTERVSAGKSLAFVGDPRLGVGVVEKDGILMPDIAWGEEVPAGTYEIGGDKDASSLDRCQVMIERPYRLSRYPITNAQFQSFIDAPDWDDASWWQGILADERKLNNPNFPFDNHPRENVSWYQVIAFCRWLSDKLGYLVDLPHEYEWEAAARYPDNRFYPWGNEFEPDRANTDEWVIGQTTAVGVYPGGKQPELELFDLSGNVWEWCRNMYEQPDEAWLDRDPVNDSGDWRVLRGGSWDGSRSYARAASRSEFNSDNRNFNVGFRVVRRSPSHPEH